MLPEVLHVQAVKEPEDGHEGEDVGKDQAQLVHPADDDVKAQVIEAAVDPGGHGQYVPEGQGREDQQVDLPQAAGQQGDQQGPEE